MPEVAQRAYSNALEQEAPVGNYLSMPDCSVKVTSEVRTYMITVINEVHRIKDYKETTLYLASSIADRYLFQLAQFKQPSPCLIKLALVSLLMAAKLEESI